MERREFVLGSLAALAAVGLAACTKKVRGIPPAEAIRFEHSPPPSPVVVTDTLRSKYVAVPVGYVVARPARIPLSKTLPVVFCLPGRGGTAASAAAGGLPETLWGEIARDKVPPFGLVYVDGGESYWHARSSGEDRMSMLIQDLLPTVADRYSLGGTRGVMGWSMGGYGALLAAETFPRLFTAVAVASPAIWPSYEAMMLGPGDAFDSAADFTAHDVFAAIGKLDHTAVRIDCGEQDPFYTYVSQFVDAFPSGQAPEGGFGPGEHSGSYWQTLQPAQIGVLRPSFQPLRPRRSRAQRSTEVCYVEHMSRSVLDDAFGHHVWATLRLIDACLTLSPEQLETTVPGTYGSIVETMRHLVGADSWYLFDITGDRAFRIEDERMDLAELRAAMAADGTAWSRLLGDGPDADAVLGQVDEDGSETRAPLGIRLAQVLHHGTDHRSQICTALTSLGVEPPAIDVWDFGEQDGRVVTVPPTP